MVVGSLNYDHVVTVDQLPGRGQTVSGHGYISVPGGKGLNQAVTAARLGAQVSMVGCVGSDPAGSSLRDVLTREGVEAGTVRTIAGLPSGTALITVEKGGGNTIVVAAGANGDLGPEDVEAARGLMAPSSVVLAQLEVPFPAVEAVLRLGRALGAVTVLNPSPVTGPLPRSLVALVDVLVPNETEALALTGCLVPAEAAERLLNEGCAAVVITLGEKGALVAEAGSALGGSTHVPGASGGYDGGGRRLLRGARRLPGRRGRFARGGPTWLCGRCRGHHGDGRGPELADIPRRSTGSSSRPPVPPWWKSEATCQHSKKWARPVFTTGYVRPVASPLPGRAVVAPAGPGPGLFAVIRGAAALVDRWRPSTLSAAMKGP